MDSPKFLAIDYGEKRIGLAASFSGIIANPLKIISSDRYTDLITTLVIEIKKLNPQKIVIGVPLNAQGQPTDKSKKVMEFGKTLEELFYKKEFYYVNEFLTSSEAKYRTSGSRAQKDDAHAAAIILEQFLNENKQPL